VIDRLRERGSHEAAAHAERLVHVLPPRTGGPLTLLDASPGLDVLFCAHTGFEGAARLSDLGNGALVGAPVRVRFWRVPREAVPHDPDARRLWLWEQWQRMDRTVGALRGAAGPTGATAS